MLGPHNFLNEKFESLFGDLEKVLNQVNEVYANKVGSFKVLPAEIFVSSLRTQLLSAFL